MRLGTIPADLPDGPFDLVVASEILYYLDADELQATLDRLCELLAPGARLVAVHWRPAGPERPLTAAAVHAALRALPWLTLAPSPGTRTPSCSTPSPAREHAIATSCSSSAAAPPPWRPCALSATPEVRAAPV